MRYIACASADWQSEGQREAQYTFARQSPALCGAHPHAQAKTYRIIDV